MLADLYAQVSIVTVAERAMIFVIGLEALFCVVAIIAGRSEIAPRHGALKQLSRLLSDLGDRAKRDQEPVDRR